MLSKIFWFGERGVLVRAIRTFAQTAIAMIGVSSFSVWSVDWQNVLGVSLGSALLSMLMSLDRSTEGAVMVSEPAPTVVEVPPAVSCGDQLR